MNRPQTLTAAFVKRVTAPGRYGDGRGSHGLSLLVKPTAIEGRYSKTFAQRLRVNGRQVHIGLGPYPLVTLAEARETCLENARLARQGLDPRTVTAAPTFAETAEAAIEMHRAGWRPGSRSEQQWRASLGAHVLPVIGDRPIDAIGVADVLRVLAPVWIDTPETGRRLASRISAVMAHAIASGHRTDDPTPAVTAALPRHKNGKQHHRAVNHADLATVLAHVRETAHGSPAALALEFIALTACRSNEARSMSWAEIDGDVWTIPGERTKTGKPHRVPLSGRALAVLAETGTKRTGYVFAGSTGRPVSNEAVRKLLNGSGTTHGLRSSFRDWCSETGVNGEVAEQALGHAVKGVEGAYRRSDLLEARRAVMADWAAYLG